MGYGGYFDKFLKIWIYYCQSPFRVFHSTIGLVFYMSCVKPMVIHMIKY